MQYMLMCCIDEAGWMQLPDAERGTVMDEYHALIDDLVRSGHYRGGAKLRGIATATTVRQRAGRPVITDGPFAETKEQLGGFHLIECADLDEALAIAQRIPPLRVGASVEVRPLESMLETTPPAAPGAPGASRSAVTA
jgi:hypothetical protein